MSLATKAIPRNEVTFLPFSWVSFDPKERVLIGDISQKDFDYWLRKLPKRKSCVEDVVSYEIWQ